MTTKSKNEEMGQIVCTLCKERFSSKEARRIHTIHCKNTEKCGGCNVPASKFTSFQSFYVHKRNSENGKLWCAQCGKKDFKKKDKHTLEKLLNDHYSKCRRKPIICNKCNKQVRKIYKNELAEHVKKYHPTFDCDICGAICQTHEILRQHKRQEHNAPFLPFHSVPTVSLTEISYTL